jgi:ATPase subunit of ABC transporter with duplicated ATPase domains
MGKSTLLDLLSGLQEPDGGTVQRGETVAIGRSDQLMAPCVGSHKMPNAPGVRQVRQGTVR